MTPPSRYVNINKVIDDLIDANIIDEHDYLNIYFTDFYKNDKFYGKQWTIKPIGFKVIKNIRVKDNGPSVPVGYVCTYKKKNSKMNKNVTCETKKNIIIY